MQTIPITPGHIAAATTHKLASAAASSLGIARIVADYYRIPLVKLLGRERTSKVALVRQIAMTLAYRLTPESIVDVGRFFKREHSTVLHARKTVNDLCSTDRTVRRDIDALLIGMGHPRNRWGSMRIVT